MINSEVIRRAFYTSKQQANDSDLTNKLRSALFVENMGHELMKIYDLNVYKSYCQHVNFDNKKKDTGEWLLDLLIGQSKSIFEPGAKIRHEFISSIEWAVESEYATSLKEFLQDFSKLMVIQSKNKFYLNGYRSDNLEELNKYVSKRLRTAAQLISECDEKADFYYGFWPSPEKYHGDSFWNKTKIANEIIQLYKWNSSTNEFERHL